MVRGRRTVLLLMRHGRETDTGTGETRPASIHLLRVKSIFKGFIIIFTGAQRCTTLAARKLDQLESCCSEVKHVSGSYKKRLQQLKRMPWLFVFAIPSCL
jgi:hypothetical protein